MTDNESSVFTFLSAISGFHVYCNEYDSHIQANNWRQKRQWEPRGQICCVICSVDSNTTTVSHLPIENSAAYSGISDSQRKGIVFEWFYNRKFIKLPKHVHTAHCGCNPFRRMPFSNCVCMHIHSIISRSQIVDICLRTTLVDNFLLYITLRANFTHRVNYTPSICM